MEQATQRPEEIPAETWKQYQPLTTAEIIKGVQWADDFVKREAGRS